MDDERTLSPELIESIQKGIAEAHAGKTTPWAKVKKDLGLDSPSGE